jgi:quinoprotein glucose dehydrogenase
LSEVTNISPAAHAAVLETIRRKEITFGWFRPFDEGKPVALFGIHGGAEWTGACFDPASGMLYVSANEMLTIPWVNRNERPTVDETKLPPTPGRTVYEKSCMPCHGPSREGLTMNPSLLGLSQRMGEPQVRTLLKTGRGTMPVAAISESDTKALLDYLFDRDRPDVKPTTRPQRPSYRYNGYPRLQDAENYPGNKPPWGTLNAIDLNTGKIAWKVPLGEDEELTRRGVPKTGTENFGGPTVTGGGLVFCAGTRDLKIRAFDSSTGEELWSHSLPFGGFAPPSIYEVNGKQYVVIAATGGGKLAVPPLPGLLPAEGDAYVAFALP